MANPVKITARISEQACVNMAATCNLYCVYCHKPPSGVKPDPLKTAAGIKRSGARSVSLEGGGEPTTNPRFFDWIKALKTAGVKNFMLSTNAVALSNKAFCARTATEMDFFTVNFPSHRPEIYAKVTRSVKFPLAIKGLANLKDVGAESKIRFFHIISRYNYRLLPEFAEWAAANFPRLAFVNFTFVWNKGRVRDDADIVPRYSEVTPFLKMALAKLKLKGIKAVVQNVPLCFLGSFEGFSFEYQRWLRGDRVLEDGLEASAYNRACARCRLNPACCGARPDYIKVHGTAGLKASRKDPRALRPERF